MRRENNGYNYANERIMTTKFKYDRGYLIIIGVGLYTRDRLFLSRIAANI